MADDRWEVVGKPKKNRDKNEVKNNIAKKTLQSTRSSDNMKLAESGSIETSTMFGAFLEKDRQERQATFLQHPETNVVTSKVKEVSTQKKKKKAEKKVVQPPSKAVFSEEIFQTITEDSLRKNLATAKERFPDSPLFWLKDLFSYMNSKLDVAFKDNVFSSSADGYPCSMLSKGAYAVLANAFKNSPTATLQIFFEVGMQTLIQDTIKGLHTLGYYLILQCLAKEMPSIVRANLSKCVEHLNTYKNRQDVCLSILWVCGQASHKSLETGFQVWNELMFPVIHTKACSNYSVSYLEKLLRSEKFQKIDIGIISVKELFPVLDFLFSKDLPVNLQKRLLPLYPKLKQLSYGSESKTVLRNYFPSYLRRLEPHCSPMLKNEILNSLRECLLEDTHCFSVWRQLYVKHLVQSKLLIMELNENWESLPSGFPKKPLHETLRTFQVTNEELLAQGKSTHVESIIPIVDELLLKMDSQRFKWHWIILILLLLLSAALAYDVQKHGTFKDSATGKFMEDSGLMETIKQAMGKINIYYKKGVRWLEINIPVFTKWFQKVSKPYFDLFWKELFSFCMWFWKSTGALRIWCSKNIASLLIMLDKTFPIYAVKVLEITQKLAVILVDQASTAIQAVVYYGSSIQDLPIESIQKTLYNVAEISQQYILLVYDWVHKHIFTS